MNKHLQTKLAEAVKDFRLPKYRDLPDMGLYLEQTAKYLNVYLNSLGCGEITTSMISNYVKKGFIAAPVKKQYYADQIAHLMVIAIVKNVVSMENIGKLFKIQEKLYPAHRAYDYFCDELENCLMYIFGLKPEMDVVGVNNTDEKLLIRGIVISVCYRLHLNILMEHMASEDDET